MKLKLNNSEMGALCMLLNSLVIVYNQQMIDGQLSMEDKLYKAIFEELNLKFATKWLVKQDKYTINLKPHQAIAWHLRLAPRFNVGTHAGLLAQKISDAAHQKYC